MIGTFFAALITVLNPVDAIVTDIEGTTTSISFVQETLFPYAKEHVQEFVNEHQNEPIVQKILKEVQEIASVPSEDTVAVLLNWMAEDKKITPLKALQGMMWTDGYRQGAFQGHVYKDAYDQMNLWKKKGLDLHVYSSGSVQAQKLLFSYSTYGDITSLFSSHFDTKIGGKKESSSYRSIAQQIGVAPERILFLSDSLDELNAAKDSGMQTILLYRDGESLQDFGHPVAKNFYEITIP